MPKPQIKPGRVLIAVAAPSEAQVVRHSIGIGSTGPNRGVWAAEQGERGFDLVNTGVGKAQAAAGVVRVFDPDRHAGVLNVGIAGALPGCTAKIGDAVLADRSLFGDEGIATPDGFTPIEVVGFPAGPFGAGGLGPPGPWREALAGAVEAVMPIVTVSTCSGRDDLAEELARRFGAGAEAMEGAAIAAGLYWVVSRPVFAEVRVISNTAGDRDRQRWDLDAAFDRLGRLVSGLDGSVLADLVSGR